MIRKTNLLSVVLLVATGCASAGMRPGTENIPALEQRANAQPSNMDAATNLGVAYYNAKRFDDARKTLARVVEMNPKSSTAYLYLGLANEDLNDWTAARTAYEKYLATSATASARDQIRARLAYVARQQLKQDAKTVLAREQQMSQEPPTPRTVAVMPFKLVGTSEDLAPLQTALSDMIITDLSVSPSITSIERVKVDAMIGEMLLTQSGLADEQSGVRVGRLLKAENVVQGVLEQTGDKQLRADATVLNTARQQTAGTFNQNNQVDAIFDLEKALVFNIFNTVGVTLTASEREKINENRTGNLLAFLAYGHGLNSLDQGNYQQAATYFRQATQLDPNFQRASSQQTQAVQLQQAQQMSTSDIAATAGPEAPAGASDMLSDIGHDIAPSPGDNLPQGNGTPLTNDATLQAQDQSANVNNAQGQPSSITNSTKTTIVITIQKPGT